MPKKKPPDLDFRYEILILERKKKKISAIIVTDNWKKLFKKY